MRNAIPSVLASLALHAAVIAGAAGVAVWMGRDFSGLEDIGVRSVPEGVAPAEFLLELVLPSPEEQTVRFDPPRPVWIPEPDPPSLDPFVDGKDPDAEPREGEHPRPSPVPPVFDRLPRTTAVRVSAAAAVEAPPTEIHNPPPEYPALAVRRRWEGSVVVRFEVRPDGRCGEVAVLESSGHALLDDAAMRAVRDWRFKPAVRNGAAVAARQVIRFTFRLEK